jgi:hypothetical protein
MCEEGREALCLSDSESETVYVRAWAGLERWCSGDGGDWGSVGCPYVCDGVVRWGWVVTDGSAGSW